MGNTKASFGLTALCRKRLLEECIYLESWENFENLSELELILI